MNQILKEITKSELLKKYPSFLLVDVREDSEWQYGIIDGAILISLKDFNYQSLRPHIKNNDGPIVIYCRSGVRSAVACNMLKIEAEHLSIFNLKGGIIAWNQN